MHLTTSFYGISTFEKTKFGHNIMLLPILSLFWSNKNYFTHKALHAQYFSVVSNRIFNPFSNIGNGRHLYKRAVRKNYPF